jgi:hypothetical protein
MTGLGGYVTQNEKNIHEEVNKLMDKSLFFIFSMFLVVHQYQYDAYYFNSI